MKHPHAASVFLSYLPWLLLLLGVDAFASLLLWLADAQAFYATVLVIVLATIGLFAAVCAVLVRRERKRAQAFSEFLASPDEYHETLLLRSSDALQSPYIHALGNALRNGQAACTALQAQVSDYEEYVEAWAHETKTPLSLLTLLLDNHREELSPAVAFRLDYIRSRIQGSVEQMLFYARVKSARKDYLFELLGIRDCIEAVLEDYQPLLEEKQFQIRFSLDEDTVYSDRRGLCFLLGQLVSNSIKYCRAEPELFFESFRSDGRCILCIRDNGTGVQPCDLPYIFEKGFTGGSGDTRKKATGMGLYLAREVAEEMNLSISADSVWRQGFTIQLAFPEVEEKGYC